MVYPYTNDNFDEKIDNQSTLDHVVGKGNFMFPSKQDSQSAHFKVDDLLNDPVYKGKLLAEYPGLGMPKPDPVVAKAKWSPSFNDHPAVPSIIPFSDNLFEMQLKFRGPGVTGNSDALSYRFNPPFDMYSGDLTESNMRRVLQNAFKMMENSIIDKMKENNK